MLKRLLFSLSLCLATTSFVGAAIDDITPSAPVKNFRYPRFGENGYVQWVLKGSEGIYDSEEQIRVMGMGLRLYTGDERMTVEMSLDSPEATLRLQDNKAFSDSAIEIVGQNFKITGIGWTWDGNTREIEVLEHAVVEFRQAISEAMPGVNAIDAADVRETIIRSQRLKLRTTEEFYYFNFREDVHVLSADMELKCKALMAVAETSQGSEAQTNNKSVTAGELESLSEIRARGDVLITQQGRVVRAGAADFFPRKQLVNLGDKPTVELSGAYIAGNLIRMEQGEVEIHGGGDSGRAQMFLTKTGGLGIQGASALSSETIILADQIRMRELEQENRFNFDGSVEVMSGALQLRSDTMTIFANHSNAKASTAKQNVADEAQLNVGEVRSLVAEGNVRIEQSGQYATSDKVVFHPLEERAVLTGKPKVTNGEAIVSGSTMQLKQGLAIVEGSGEERVVVTLPVLPDLGYDGVAALVADDKKSPIEGAEPKTTVIRSYLVRMIEQPGETLFEFRNKVQISATNLDATCEQMDVIARDKSKSASTGQLDERLQVERIEANEAVMIEQSGRVATARKAVILPVEGRLILEGDAVVTDAQGGRVSGHRLFLNQGERRAVIDGGAGRAKITLPEFQL